MSIHTKSLLNTTFNDQLYDEFKTSIPPAPTTQTPTTQTPTTQTLTTQTPTTQTLTTQSLTLNDIKRRQVNLFQSILTQQQLHDIPDLPLMNLTKQTMQSQYYTPLKSKKITSQIRSSSQKARRARIKNKYTNKVFRNLYTKVIENDPNRDTYHDHISSQIGYFFFFVFCGSIFGIIFAARTTDTVLGVTIGIISSSLLFIVAIYSYIIQRIDGDAFESTASAHIFYIVSFIGSIAGLITFSIKAHNLTK